MKKLLLILLLFPLLSKAQMTYGYGNMVDRTTSTKSFTEVGMQGQPDRNKNPYKKYYNDPSVTYYKLNAPCFGISIGRNDTLEVTPGKGINFIKVGDKVYKVVVPTPFLEETKKPDELYLLLRRYPAPPNVAPAHSPQYIAPEYIHPN